MPKLKKESSTPPAAYHPLVPRVSLSVVEVAYATSLSKSYLYLAMKAGTLKYIKAGGRRLIAVSELEAFLAHLPQGPEAA
jgi:excisionase family DNA binding protein